MSEPVQQSKTQDPGGFQASQTVSLEFPVAQSQPSSDQSSAVAERISDLTDLCIYISSPCLMVALFLISSFVALIPFCKRLSSKLFLFCSSRSFFLIVCFNGCLESDGSGLFLGTEELWAAPFLMQEARDSIFQPAARALTVTWQSRDWDCLWNMLSYYIRIPAWGNTMIPGGFNENCFGMMWFKRPSCSHHVPLVINMLVPKPDRFESISKYNPQLTWERTVYPLESLQLCN